VHGVAQGPAGSDGQAEQERGDRRGWPVNLVGYHAGQVEYHPFVHVSPVKAEVVAACVDPVSERGH
jgi:hypothetical protein